MFEPPSPRSRAVRMADALLIVLGLGVLVLLTTRYQMPFRLDDVLHMDWAREHRLLDAFHVQHGEIVRSVRPLFAMTIWILTHTAGTESYFAWHVTLVGSFLIGLLFTGLTARYIAQKASALYLTVIIFWIAFLPILNVLFWFGDLTFTIELMFVASAWYFGLRGLCEARVGSWVLGCFLGICAVLSKEPAIVMVNAVFLGTFAFYPRDILTSWKKKTKQAQLTAIGGYILLLFVCLKIYFASPTRSNRFFDLTAYSKEELLFFVADRIRYYGAFISSGAALFLFLVPLWLTLIIRIVSIRSQAAGKRKYEVAVFVIVVTIVLQLLLQSPFYTLGLYIITPICTFFLLREHARSLMLLPFALCVCIIFFTLLVTVMLVKTQLTELAFCIIVPAGYYWSFVFPEFRRNKKTTRPQGKQKKAILWGSVLIIAAVGSYLFIPRIFAAVKAKEALLREVQATRFNANDAIKWMARKLPPQSTVLLAGPHLYGAAGESDLTGLDDETKAFSQYTFLQGYVRIYFHQLGRFDLRIAYLEDSTMLHRALDGFRSEDNAYLFLQNGRDRQRFHSTINGVPALQPSDTMVTSFNRGSFPAEVWKLQR